MIKKALAIAVCSCVLSASVSMQYTKQKLGAEHAKAQIALTQVYGEQIQRKEDEIQRYRQSISTASRSSAVALWRRM